MTTITYGNGNQTIVDGSNETIIAGNGNDSITIGSSDTLTVGSGNDTITAGSNDSITVGNGNDTVVMGAGDTVTIGNGTGTGTDNLTASQGSTINIGSGTHTVNVTGTAQDTINVGTGNNTVTVTGATASTITAGNGNNVITLIGGSGNAVTIGDGNDTIAVSGEFGDSITVGNGNNTVYLGANDVLHMGKGSDLVVVPSSTPTLTVNAINVAEGGVVSLAALGFSAGFSSSGFGQETIYGLAGADQLEFTTAQFANFAAVTAAATQVGQNTVISDAGGDTITLENVSKSSLSAKNFVFVNLGASAGNVLVTITGLPAGLSGFNGGSYNGNTGTWNGTAAQFNALTFKAGEETSANLTVTTTDTVTGYSIAKTVGLTITQPAINISISGTPQEGRTLAASVTVSSGDAFTYQWQSAANGSSNWSDITGANSATCTAQDSDDGRQLRVKVTLVDDNYAVTSAATVAVADAPLTATGVNVSATEGASTGSVVVAKFTDAYPGNHTADFTATIAWGDGHMSAGTVS